jgi:hypothetical protein
VGERAARHAHGQHGAESGLVPGLDRHVVSTPS